MRRWVFFDVQWRLRVWLFTRAIAKYDLLMDSREALLALNLLPDIGPVRVRNLLSRFESAAAVLSAYKADLMLVDKVGVKAAAISITRKTPTAR